MAPLGPETAPGHWSLGRESETPRALSCGPESGQGDGRELFIRRMSCLEPGALLGGWQGHQSRNGSTFRPARRVYTLGLNTQVSFLAWESALGGWGRGAWSSSFLGKGVGGGRGCHQSRGLARPGGLATGNTARLTAEEILHLHAYLVSVSLILHPLSNPPTPPHTHSWRCGFPYGLCCHHHQLPNAGALPGPNALKATFFGGCLIRNAQQCALL